MFVRKLRKLFALFGKNSPSAKKSRCRLFLEALEDRTVPSYSGQLVWTGPSGGSWSSSANWTDPGDNNHYAPSSTDQLLFGDGGVGADTNSTMDYSSLTVDRVIMDSHYTHTITIPSGNTLTTTNYFQQYGTLSMTGSATLDTGTYIDIYGTVNASTGMAVSVLDASGNFYLYSSGTITDTGADALHITSANFSDSGTITVGSSTAKGVMKISGAFTQSAGAITIETSSSLLTFDSQGSASAYPILEGTVSMVGGGAEIDTDTQLALSGGTLSATGGGDVIGGSGGGNLRIYNSGVVKVGTSGTPSATTLELATGSITVGALDPAGTATGGTLDVYPLAEVEMPAATGVNSNFDVTPLGVIDMYGGTLSMDTTRVSDLHIHTGNSTQAAGQLNSYGYSGGADHVTGYLTNDGVVDFGGASLHTLDVSDDYTQGADGVLEMRLDNSAKNDFLDVTGTAYLDGTLTLTGLHTLSSFQTWTIIAYGSSSGDFDTVNFPDTNPRWVAGPPGAGTYDVSN